MTEKASQNYIADNCALEGIQGRPVDCKNNPLKYPDNFRPNLCLSCPENSLFSKAAESYLPTIYVKIKQEIQNNKNVDKQS